MKNALENHWREYLSEAFGLGAFMVSACAFGVLLFHPSVAPMIENDFWRRGLMGLAMGATAVLIICSPFGKRSGAHINPAVTLVFFRLGKIKGADTIFYIAAQFIGGSLGVFFFWLAFGESLENAAVNYVVTAPGEHGLVIAFVAEFAVSFGLMATVLITTNTAKLSRFTPIFAGFLVAIFITFEAPFSGMSMNPARSFASAGVAENWDSIWIYFVAPTAAMFAAAGCKPFHVPLGIQLKENDRQSSCVRCSTCDGFPCLLNAKSDAQICAVEPSLNYKNVTLLTNAQVLKLETDAGGRNISAVRVKRAGAEEIYSADIVAVSCGAINSAALLLRSANEKHPNGLANSSDQVGRNYMGHINSVLMAVSKCPNPTVFQKTLALNDFYFGAEDFPFPMGHISFVGKLDGATLSAGAPAIAPGFTLDLMAKHSLDFWLTTEDLPRPENRVSLERV